MTLWKLTRNIHLALPEELLVEIDEAAKSMYMCRAEYIRFILRKEIVSQQTKIRSSLGNTDPGLLDLDDS